MKTFIKIDNYLALPKETREALVQTFAINKSQGMSIRNNKMVSDGTTQQDLINGLTIGKMIDFLGDGWYENIKKDSKKKTILNDELYDLLLTNCLVKINDTIKKRNDKGINATGATANSENKGAEIKSEGTPSPAVKV